LVRRRLKNQNITAGVEICSSYENRRRSGVSALDKTLKSVSGVSKDASFQKGVFDFEVLHGTMIQLFGQRISCRDGHTKAAVILYTPRSRPTLCIPNILPPRDENVTEERMVLR
jgi:hypothetical protein